MTGLILLLVIVGVIVILVRLGRSNVATHTPIGPAELTPIHVAGVAAEPAETFYLEQSAKWLEFHAERKYTGGYGGVSVRVVRGLSISTGSTRGQSRSVQVAESTPGTIYLSDKRILFIGRTFSREVHLGTVLHFGIGRGFIHIDRPNRSSIQIDTGDNRLSDILKVILSRRAHPVGPAGTHAPTAPIPIPTHDFAAVNTNVGTKKWVIDQLIVLLDKTFPALQSEYDQACTSPLAPSGIAMTQSRSLAWIQEKTAALAPDAVLLAKIAATDLSVVLSTSADQGQASTAQQKWLHECSAFCNQLIDWELDVKTARLDPLFAHAQTLMRGMTGELFSAIMNIRTQLAVAINPKDPKPLRIVTEPSGDLAKPLAAEIERIIPMMDRSTT